MARRDAGELVEGRALVQLFRVERKDLACLSPVIATYQRQAAGSVAVSLFRVESEAQLRERLAPAPTGWWSRLTGRRPSMPVLGEPLAALTIDCAAVTDNETIDLAFGPLDVTPGELLALRFEPLDTAKGSAPTFWLTDAAERIPGHLACFVQGEDQGALGLEAKALHGGRISELSVPKLILYSPVTQCNLNCIHCISRSTRKRVAKLAAPIRAQLQEWCATGQVESICTDYSGDILWAETRFGGELDFLIALDVALHIDTNGACLSEEIARRLCRSRLVSLNISLDAAEPETYRRIRKGAPPLDEVLANIEAMMRIRAATGAKFTVSTSMSLMRSNLREWPDFIRMGARLGVDFVHARHMEAYTEDMEADSLWHDQAAYNTARLEAIALAEQLGVQAGAPAPFSGRTVTGRRSCDVPWHAAAILGNGDVQACCIPDTVMGNLHEQSMEEIWNGQLYQALRATVNSSRPMPACAACPMFRKTDNPDSYLIWSATRRLAAAREAAA
jgi:MoaA/NifB/PqqE/SkfB family radical SAM enzyme